MCEREKLSELHAVVSTSLIKQNAAAERERETGKEKQRERETGKEKQRKRERERAKERERARARDKRQRDETGVSDGVVLNPFAMRTHPSNIPKRFNQL